MLLHASLKKAFFVLLCVGLAGCDEDSGLGWGEDNMQLNAAELVQLIRWEQGIGKGQNEFSREPNISHQKKVTVKHEEELHDEEALKRRKVWSRWSKWSRCSNSCGAGHMTRMRLCVSGRCAPGEKEEQHRSCDVTPCEAREVPKVTTADNLDVPADVDPDAESIE